jgi:gluconokinase
MPNPSDEPMVLLVTGVSGSGKTTVGMLLAERLGWAYAEADSFHPAANVAKMAAGHPLDDADREPWLAAIGEWIDATTRAGAPAVVTCSALKRSYRDRLRAGRPNVRLVYLDADEETIAARLAGRRDHFFPPDLLASQFRDLEPPAADEDAWRVRVDAPAEQTVDRLIAAGVAS